MGKNSRQRREAKRRAQPRRIARQTRAAGPGPADQLTQPQIIDLIGIASQYATISRRVVAPKVAELNEIGTAASSPHLDPASLVVDEAMSMLRSAWEHGWQPAELVHATRRRTSAASATWMASAVLVEADDTSAADRAPQAWIDQLQALSHRRDTVTDAARLLPARGHADLATWTAALVALELLHRLPRSQVLMPPPSRWDQVARIRPSSAPRPREPQTKTLTKIRALLAKAESTDFAAEADAFTAKAQDLMTRHSIDEALLADEAGDSFDVAGSKILIHHPYGLEKASLLHVISAANRVKAIWNEFASCVTIVGVPTDLEQVEMLFTSTLVQATRAMTQAGEHSVGQDRSSSFRKAFLSAYAVRIGERLSETSEQTTASYGSALVPVLERQTEAVSEEFERLFPHVTTGSRRTRFDARGWDAGTRAADEAVLPAGEVAD
ncbi:DUF2786 domain-containing protein [Aeromicrobium sp. CF3.5]|uniref:DUF2786 domain-containing protein n=1 Tax=Aeromicrobium sp. CF3.5 TaxID=3373078 RepID=UPI003EE804DF